MCQKCTVFVVFFQYQHFYTLIVQSKTLPTAIRYKHCILFCKISYLGHFFSGYSSSSQVNHTKCSTDAQWREEEVLIRAVGAQDPIQIQCEDTVSTTQTLHD